eukprot:1161654-Pelagomonas_calceolata.AAC.11
MQWVFWHGSSAGSVLTHTDQVKCKALHLKQWYSTAWPSSTTLIDNELRSDASVLLPPRQKGQSMHNRAGAGYIPCCYGIEGWSRMLPCGGYERRGAAVCAWLVCKSLHLGYAWPRGGEELGYIDGALEVAPAAARIRRGPHGCSAR